MPLKIVRVPRGPRSTVSCSSLSEPWTFAQVVTLPTRRSTPLKLSIVAYAASGSTV